MSEQVAIQAKYRIDWTAVGSDFNGTDELKAKVLDAIADIDRNAFEEPGEWSRWHEVHPNKRLTLAMMPAQGISETIKQLRLPHVTAVGISALLSPMALYGVRANYGARGVFQTVDVFVVDHGDGITPVCARVHLNQ